MKSCPVCYSSLNDSVTKCDCGYNFNKNRKERIFSDVNEGKNEKKVIHSLSPYNYPSSQYATGRKISRLISWVGWFIVLVGVFSIFTSGHKLNGFFLALITGILGLFLVATGQVMLAIMDNADNTSKIVRLLAHL